MNFLESAHMHGLIHVGENISTLQTTWGNRACTVVTPEKSQQFLQELLSSDFETLKKTYSSEHLLVLTDAAWTNYEDVFSRTLFLCTQPKLLIVVSSLYECDLLPLLNLVRGNDRLPLLFDEKLLHVAARDSIMYSTANTTSKPIRNFVASSFNPFDPYPTNTEDNTEFTKLLYVVPSGWSLISAVLETNGSFLFTCASEKKKMEAVRFFRCHGFQLVTTDHFKRNQTSVYVTCSKTFRRFDVDEIHVLDPPENLALCASQATRSDARVYLYTSYTGPFDESSQLKKYRETLGRYVKQHDALHMRNVESELQLPEIITGLFVHNPLWSRASLVARVQCIHKKTDRNSILIELTRMVEEKTLVTDMFETPGYIVFSESLYIFQPEIDF